MRLTGGTLAATVEMDIFGAGSDRGRSKASYPLETRDCSRGLPKIGNGLQAGRCQGANLGGPRRRLASLVIAPALRPDFLLPLERHPQPLFTFSPTHKYIYLSLSILCASVSTHLSLILPRLISRALGSDHISLPQIVGVNIVQQPPTQP